MQSPEKFAPDRQMYGLALSVKTFAAAGTDAPMKISARNQTRAGDCAANVADRRRRRPIVSVTSVVVPTPVAKCPEAVVMRPRLRDRDEGRREGHMLGPTLLASSASKPCLRRSSAPPISRCRG